MKFSALYGGQMLGARDSRYRAVIAEVPSGVADDGLWPSCQLAQIAFDRLKTSGHTDTHDDAFHCFADAGHWIGAPGWPTFENYATSIGGSVMVLGGTPGGTARAQRQSHKTLRAFLAKTIGPPAGAPP